MKENYKINNIILGVVAVAVSLLLIVIFFGNTPSSSSPSVKLQNNTSTTEQGDGVSIENTAYIGNPETAKLAIVQFSDLECPACKSYATETLPEIKKNFIDTGKVVYYFKELPLSQHEPVATRETKILMCAFDQNKDGNKYYELSEFIFSNTASNGLGFKEDLLKNKVSEMGYDLNSVLGCADSDKMDSLIKTQTTQAVGVGVEATPSFLVGKLENGNVDGELLVGSSKYEDWVLMVEEMTAKYSK